jgi:hypothetical protein
MTEKELLHKRERKIRRRRERKKHFANLPAVKRAEIEADKEEAHRQAMEDGPKRLAALLERAEAND